MNLINLYRTFTKGIVCFAIILLTISCSRGTFGLKSTAINGYNESPDVSITISQAPTTSNNARALLGAVTLSSNIATDSDNLGIPASARISNNSIATAQILTTSATNLPLTVAGYIDSSRDLSDYYEVTIGDTPVTVTLNNTDEEEGIALSIYDEDGTFLRKVYHSPSSIELSNTGTYFLEVSAPVPTIEGNPQYNLTTQPTETIYRLNIKETVTIASNTIYPITHFSVLGTIPNPNQPNIIRSNTDPSICARAFDTYTDFPENDEHHFYQPYASACDTSKTSHQWYVREDNSISNGYQNRCFGFIGIHLRLLNCDDSLDSDQLKIGIHTSSSRLTFGYNSGYTCLLVLNAYELGSFEGCHQNYQNETSQRLKNNTYVDFIPVSSTTGIRQSFEASETTKQLRVTSLPGISIDRLQDITIQYENIDLEFQTSSWLTATLEASERENELSLELTVNRLDLPNGSYVGRVLLTLQDDQGNIEQTFPIHVDATVQRSAPQYQIEDLITVTFNAIGEELDPISLTVQQQNSFIAALQNNQAYEAIASTDLNNNGILCELGELCDRRIISATDINLIIFENALFNGGGQ